MGPASPEGPAATQRVAAGVGFVLLAAALWGTFGVTARVALGDGVPPIDIAFWRTVIAAACFAGHVLVAHLASRGAAIPRASDAGTRPGATAQPRRWIRANDLPGITLFALLGIAALYATLPLAVEAGGATLAAVLLYTAPAWVALFAALLLGERITRRTIVALCLTLAGIAGIALAGEGASRATPTAIGWGLAAGLSYASLYLFGKFYFARYSPPLVFLAALPVAALVLAPLTAFAPVTPRALVALLALGIVCTYLPYLAYGAALARLEATRTATIATVEPLIAALLAWIFWDERLPAAAYVAALLVVAGVVVMARSRS